MNQDPYTFLKETISKKLFITKSKEKIVDSKGAEMSWIFEFRRVLMDSDVLTSITDLFWRKFENKTPFQVGGLEVAAIPLMTGIIMGLREKSQKVNGFFIRKSRKKSGLLLMVEGNINDDNIILVDDVLNTGFSFMRQIEVIESLGKKVIAVFVILRYRDLDYYTYLNSRGIEIHSLFTLDDFRQELDVKNIVDKNEAPVPIGFKSLWVFKSSNPDYYHVIPKSTPVIDKEKLYFGGDNGTFWAINQENGSVAWSNKIITNTKNKHIFSSPVIHNNVVFFGAYDGNFYALDTSTGKKKWVFLEADWVSSSPCIAPNIDTVFVGLLFGLWNKNGGIVAINIKNGEKLWEYISKGNTSSSPAYSKEDNLVSIGDDDGIFRTFDAKSGNLIWEFKTSGSIKGGPAIDTNRKLIIFGSLDKNLYIVNIQNGKIVHTIEVDQGICSTPLINNGHVYFSSLDKNLYCADMSTGKIVWKFTTRARVMSSPEIIENKIYIGSNDGRLYEIDINTGKNTSVFQVTERITNKIVHNPETNKIFLTTFANEIYCLEKK